MRVEFVQFSDGSTWGDTDSAKNVLDMRAETLTELDKLEHIYDRLERMHLKNNLAPADDHLSVIGQLKGACRDKAKTSNCGHNAVQRTIDVAKEHQTEIDSGVERQPSTPR